MVRRGRCAGRRRQGRGTGSGGGDDGGHAASAGGLPTTPAALALDAHVDRLPGAHGGGGAARSAGRQTRGGASGSTTRVSVCKEHRRRHCSPIIVPRHAPRWGPTAPLDGGAVPSGSGAAAPDAVTADEGPRKSAELDDGQQTSARRTGWTRVAPPRIRRDAPSDACHRRPSKKQRRTNAIWTDSATLSAGRKRKNNTCDVIQTNPTAGHPGSTRTGPRHPLTFVAPSWWRLHGEPGGFGPSHGAPQARRHQLKERLGPRGSEPTRS